MKLEEKEYILIRNKDGNPVAKRLVVTKELAKDVHDLILNKNILVSFKEHMHNQELCNNLPDIDDLTKENE